ncbi:MAG: membrane protein insertase YidC [Breznakibacter sp.]|nr:membrane protein insertase YidC [Breznakibacter sp.]
MDRNSIIGISLIVVIIGLFYYVNKPSEEQIAAQRKYQDSIQLVEYNKIAAEKARAEEIEKAAKQLTQLDSTQTQERFGSFSNSVAGNVEFTTLENEVVKVILSNKGGRVYSVELKKYKAFDEKPLILFQGDQNVFGFTFTHKNRVFNTSDLFFVAKDVDSKTKSFTLNAGEGSSLEYRYTLAPNSYMVDFSIVSNNLQNVMTFQRGAAELEWKTDILPQEKGRTFEHTYSGIHYKYYKDEVDDLGVKEDGEEELRTKVQWIAFKSQFFSSVLIAKDPFASSKISTTIPKDKEGKFDKEASKIYTANALIGLPQSNVNGTQDFHFYFGPNDYEILTKYESYELSELVYLGWGFLRIINLGVLYVFNFLEGFISSYGLIILILTLLIKLILHPLTYKSYISSAKMRVLKPEIDEINARISADKPMERQQATMNLYKKAGVNPLGGCLPMLLQMPILFAMFQFFPASIELRQEPFLWAADLSSFDSIYDLPFYIPFYGSHISLFTLLMAVTNIVYTHMSQDLGQSTAQMPGMKWMMYLMPILFLGMFNDYASGLSYYYFISTLISIIQTLIIRRFVDEKALLAQIHAHKAKPVTKSKFQQKLEDMQKQQAQLKKAKK